MNEALLEAKINSNNASRNEIAEALGLTRQGLYNKIKGEREFKVSEIKKLSEILNLTESEINAIFFAECVD